MQQVGGESNSMKEAGGGTFLADGGNPQLPPLNDSSGVYMGAEKNGVL